MKENAVKNALNALEDCSEIRPVDIANFLGINAGRITECKALPTIDNLGKYLSIYNDAEVNFAMSKRVSLMQCIYYQMFRLSHLVNKLAQEQRNPFDKDDMLAKQDRLDLVREYFNPSSLVREFFCREDEIYYRISDVKKALMLIHIQKKYENHDHLIAEALDELNELEKKNLEKRAEIGYSSHYDVLVKFQKLKIFFEPQEIEKIDNIISKLDSGDTGGLYRFFTASSSEENGSEINFNLVLDEFFDIEHYYDEIVDDILPKVTPVQQPFTSPDDEEEKKCGNFPIFFILEESRLYVKTYVNNSIRKRKNGEFIEAVYRCYEKMKTKLHEKKDNDDWNMACQEIKSWGEKPLKIDISRRVRKTLSKIVKEKYRLLCTIRS